MQKNDKILKRQSSKIFFNNDDTDFLFNWLLGISEIFGLSHGELFYLAHKIGRDAKPDVWYASFLEHADYLLARATDETNVTSQQSLANYYLAATYAYRAALLFTDPFSANYLPVVGKMEKTFGQAIQQLNAPVETISINYQDSYFPGYYLHCDNARPTIIMVGGGDTYREDLFYFAGYPGWKRNYSVLMVDLPGQGTNPNRGLTFTVDASKTVSVCIDWLQQRNPNLDQLAIYGVSGGGYFTAQAVEHDKRITAWIASTPIFDMAELFRREFGFALKTPGWLMNAVLKIAGNVNQNADLSLKKYAWQFGTKDFSSAVGEVLKQATIVDYSKITCPALFLMGDGEAAELRRQTKVLYDDLTKRGSKVNMYEFDAKSGADAHCQLNNLRLAHGIVFDWLDTEFSGTRNQSVDNV